MIAMAASLGKNTGTVVGIKPGTFAATGPGSLSGKNPGNSSVLPPLGRHDLIRETQSMVLHFPIKLVAEQQDSTTKAVESQRNGDSAMSLLAAVNMARANPRARAMLAKLIGVPGHAGDPDFMEAWDRFLAFAVRQHQQAEDGPAVACDPAMADLFGGATH